ncbi:MAG: hypothetical protein WDN27_05115 [Candidatus Saccharibacteria bacterium]
MNNAIQASMDEAIKIVGNDIGVPTIVFTSGDRKAGYLRSGAAETAERYREH